MQVVYVQDQSIYRYNGQYFHPKSKYFFSKYLSGFENDDKLLVYCYIYNVYNQEQILKYKNITHERIIYCEIPNYRNIFNFCKLNKIVKQAVNNADLCYLRCGISGALAGRYCRNMHKDYVAIVNEDIYQNTRIHSKLVVRLSAFPLFLANRILVKNAKFVSYVTQKYLQQKYPNNNKTLGCSDVELPVSTENIYLERMRQLKKEPPLILGTVGSVDTYLKAQDIVIKAIAELKNRGINNYIYQLVGIGDGFKLRRLAEEYNVSDCVAFLGEMDHDEVLKWMDTIDIYIHPSRSEGLPRVIIEAMTRALPCICSDVGGVSELIDSEWLISHKQANAEVQLAELLLKMSENNRKRQSKVNYERSKNYAFDVLCHRRTEFFESVIKIEKDKFNI